MGKTSGFLKDEASPSLIKWQQVTLSRILWVVLIGGSIALVPSLWGAVIEENWTIMAADLAVYAVVLLLYIKTSISYRLRVNVFVLIIILLAILLLFEVGIKGAGFIWLTVIFIISVLLSEKKFTMYAGIFVLAALGIIGYMNAKGFLAWKVPDFIWLIQTGNFFGATIGAGLAVSFLLDRLNRSLLKQEKMYLQLEEYNRELERGNEKLLHLNNQRKVLLEELNHRVRNNLQLLASLLSIEGDNEKAGQEAPLKKRYESWIWALAVIHDEELEVGKGKSIRADMLLHRLCEDHRNTSADREPEIEYIVHNTEARIVSDMSGTFSLMVSELLQMSREVLLQEEGGEEKGRLEFQCRYGAPGPEDVRTDPRFDRLVREGGWKQSLSIVEELARQLELRIAMNCTGLTVELEIFFPSAGDRTKTAGESSRY